MKSALVEQLLSDKPIETIQMMMQALESGVTPVRLAQLVSLAAAERNCSLPYTK